MQYRRKPYMIEAVQCKTNNINEIIDFLGIEEPANKRDFYLHTDDAGWINISELASYYLIKDIDNRIYFLSEDEFEIKFEQFGLHTVTEGDDEN